MNPTRTNQTTMNQGSTKSKVFLVGAGPGDPELLTLKAVRVLRSAEVVLHDDLVGAGVLNLIPKTAQIHNVGKRCGRPSMTQSEINALLVAVGSLGLQVVRLKGGDPLIFGRAGEELEALRAAGIPVEIIPGVSSALAAAAAAQIPVTHRELSSALVFLAGHHAKGQRPDGFIESLSTKVTYAIYMPGYDYAVMSARLVKGGLPSETPCAIVSQVASEGERVYRTTLRELPLAPHLPSPTMLFVGKVVRLASHASLEPGSECWLRDLNFTETDAPAVVSLTAQAQKSTPGDQG